MPKLVATEPDLQIALAFCVKVHLGQWRDDDFTLPYATHPIEVAQILVSIGGITNRLILCAGLLHDAVEETECTLEDINNTFGTRVAKIVQQLTRTEPTPEVAAKLDAKSLRELRSKMLLADISKMEGPALIIKLADRLSNLRHAKRTRRPKSLSRYQVQTASILDLVPSSANPNLWSALKMENDQELPS